MAYFKINDNDYSLYVNQLKISKQAIYKSAVNAAGNTVVKYVNTKRTFTVGIIPLEADVMAALQTDISQFQALVTYRDPETNELIEDVKCMIPINEVEYYTIQIDSTTHTEKVKYKAMLLTIIEL